MGWKCQRINWQALGNVTLLKDPLFICSPPSSSSASVCSCQEGRAIMALPVRIKIAPENEADVDFFSPFGDWFSFFDLDHDLTGNIQNAIIVCVRFFDVGTMALDRGI
jgi:hypothetical protein